jgi:putative spermidine/putrescine transport system ATP-binding protein
MKALSLSNLSKRFRDVVALDSVSLDIAEGEFVALLGPSGSGKTTLLRLLAGFDVPTSGQIFIAGNDVSRLPPSQRGIGMVFQHYALFPHLSVRRNVEYGLKMRGWLKKDRARRVDEVLAAVRLEALADRMPKQLSGGQQQRVAIARALVYAPSLLLMDEPLGALDRTLRVEMAEEIRRIHRSLKTTFVYVTHDRDEAMTLADRVLIMRHGQVISDDSPERLFAAPASGFVARFFAGMNVLTANALAALPGRPASLAHGAVGFAPSRLSFAPPQQDFITIQAQIVDRLFLGDKIQILLSCPDLGQDIVAHMAADPNIDIRPGSKVTAYIRTADVLPLAEPLA